ncbi:MAG: dTMP kinase [Oscillospiraceae bacterium]|nr:dTMP kinase [Oscillospiraceae bacterium]MDD4368303.1 dTMP kinase [Oscillospiraceae bacterium]
MKTTARFLSFEGVDGSGKSTAVNRLARFLEQQGLTVVRLREPGGTVIGEQIRDLLLDTNSRGMTPVCELYLYAASRAQLVQEVIRPALQQGDWVLCDRYTDSTMAYQGYGRGLDRDLIESLNRTATGGLLPDRTYVFDLAPEEAELRRQGRDQQAGDRMELEPVSFKQAVRLGYLDIASRQPERIRLLPARRPADQVAQLLIQQVREDFLQ